jgi:hypothetical protein
MNTKNGSKKSLDLLIPNQIYNVVWINWIILRRNSAQGFLLIFPFQSDMDLTQNKNQSALADIANNL